MTNNILERKTRMTIPENTSTTLAYGFGPDRNSQTQFETIVTDANNIANHTYRNVRGLITIVEEFYVKGDQPVLWTSNDYNPIREVSTVMDDHHNITTADDD